MKLSISYRLTTEAGETILDDSEERAYTAFQDTPTGEKKFAPFIVANRLPIEPGAYKLAIDVTNRQTQQTFKGEADVAAGPAKQASFSGPLVTTLVDRVAHPSPLVPFQYFGVQFHPAARREIHHPDPLRLLFELHEPPGSTANYQMEYIVAQSRTRERRSITDDVPQSEFKDGRLLKSKSIAINDLENGDYRLIVNLRQAGSNEVIASSNLPLRISAEKGELPLYVLSGTQALGRPGLTAYMRALEATAQKNDCRGRIFPSGVGPEPRQCFRGPVSGATLFRRRNIPPIAELYKKLGIAAFKASPVTLAQIALSFGQSGDADDARNVIDAGWPNPSSR